MRRTLSRRTLSRRTLSRWLLAALVAGSALSTGISRAEEPPLFTSLTGFATKTGARGVFAWQATKPVSGFVRYGTSPTNLDQLTAGIPGAPDTAGMAITIGDGLAVGQTYYWLVEDDLTGERSEISSFEAENAYTEWNGSTYTIDLLVQLDSESLPPGVTVDLALENIAQGMNVFAERLYDALDGYARIGHVLVTDTNLDYSANAPFLPPGCIIGVSNAADVLIQTSVPFDSHTFGGWSIDEPCISFYVGRLGQLVVPWGTGGSVEDLHFGYVAAHEMAHYAFNAPDLYDPGDVNDPRVAGCWNLDWDGSLMHNSGGWNEGGQRWELTELDRNPSLTPCDHQHSSVYTWQELRTRYTNVPERPAGPIEHILDTQARGNADGGALDIQILDREPGISTLRDFEPNDTALNTDRCNEPGFTVLTDPSYDATNTRPEYDLRSAAVVEPFGFGAGKMQFMLEVDSLANLPPDTTWPIVFKDQTGADRWVRMATDATGAVSFASGLGANPSPFVGTGTPALAGSGYDPGGTIRIVVDRAAVGNPAPGHAFTQFITRVRTELPSGGSITPDNMPNSLTRTGIYTVVGSENCASLPPVAGDDVASTLEDEAVVVPVLANDSDPEGDTLAVESPGTPGSGTAAVVAGGIRYTPNADFNGTDSFTYVLGDGHGGTDSATVTVSVTPVPDAPQAFDDRVTIVAGTSFRIPVLSNDGDADGDALTPVSATDPPNGTSQPNPDGTVRYTPDPGFTGTDVFAYTVSDGGLTDTATVTVAVLPEGQANPCLPPGPTILTDPAGDQNAGNGADLDVRALSAAGILTDGELVFTIKVEGALNPPSPSSVWRVVFTAPNNTIYYVSMETLDPFGPATFGFGTQSGSALTAIGSADSGSFTADGWISIGVRASRLGLVTPGAQLRNVAVRTQRFAGAAGSGGFVLVDGTSTATTTVAACLAEPPNDAPSAIDDSLVIDEDGSGAGTVLANDTDRNGDALSIVAFGDGDHGIVTSGTGGALKYAAEPNFNGTDSFAYTISDGQYTASAIVHVTVRAVNDAPVALDDAGSGDEDTPLILNVLANDSDVDGDLLAVTSATMPANGTVIVGGDGTLTYLPNPNYHGNDLVEYAISDGAGGSASATVFVTIASVNDVPDAVDDPVEVPKNRSLTIAVLVNDSDVDGDVLAVTSVGAARFGTTRVNPDGSITYIPNKGFKDSDSFTYTVSDGNGGVDAATVTVVVIK